MKKPGPKPDPTLTPEVKAERKKQAAREYARRKAAAIADGTYVKKRVLKNPDAPRGKVGRKRNTPEQEEARKERHKRAKRLWAYRHRRADPEWRPRVPKKLEVRLKELLIIRDDGHWQWHGHWWGAMPQVRAEGKLFKVHMALYELMVGEKMPPDTVMRKLCNGDMCVNPRHYEPVDAAFRHSFKFKIQVALGIRKKKVKKDKERVTMWDTPTPFRNDQEE